MAGSRQAQIQTHTTDKGWKAKEELRDFKTGLAFEME